MTDEVKEGVHRPKVVRLIEKYDLDGVGTELVERWTREQDRTSLRDLSTYFNKRLLTAVIRSEDRDVSSAEIDELYHAIQDDDVSSGVRTEAERRLEQLNVDIKELRTEFTSYQALRTYLVKYRGVTYERNSENRIEKEAEQIQKLENRTTAVTTDKLERLREADEITLNEFRLFTDLNVYCDGCQSQFEVTALLEEGGCNCSTP